MTLEELRETLDALVAEGSIDPDAEVVVGPRDLDIASVYIAPGDHFRDGEPRVVIDGGG